jgi:hypothetical protein
VSNEFNLDGVEIAIIKALGFGSGDISGASLAQRVSELGESELIDAVQTLVMMGYVISDKASFSSPEEFRSANFHVNSGYQRDLKGSLAPRTLQKPKSRRMRRE